MRLQGKYLFLTYPKADFDIDPYELWLRTKLGTKYVGSIICRELHQDGTHHRHVAIELSSRLDTTRGQTYFDYEGFHGNYQTARNFRAVKKYCQKTEDWKGYGKYENYEDTSDTPENERFSGRVSDAVDICTMCTDFSQWITWCLSKGISSGYCTLVWNTVKRVSTSKIYDTDAIEGTISLPDLSELAFDLDTRRALVLQGPTGIGKTTWAKLHAPKPALMVSHLDALKTFTTDIKTIIFDDMEFSHLPVTSQIHIVDMTDDRQIHCRHHVAVIPKNTYKIFTCNPSRFPFSRDDAIMRRIEHVFF